MKVTKMLMAFAAIIVVTATIFTTCSRDKEDKIVRTEEDEEIILSMCQRDLELNSFMFGGDIKVDTSETKEYEGYTYEMVKGNKYSIEWIMNEAKELYGAPDQVTFYTKYPEGRPPMFKEFDSKLYRNKEYATEAVTFELGRKLEPNELTIRDVNNIYLEAIVKISENKNVTITFERSIPDSEWKIISNTYADFGIIQDGKVLEAS